FGLPVLFEGRRLRSGEGMSEREAEYVASVVLDRIRPRARWSDEARAAPSVELQAPTPSRRSAAVIAAIVFPAMVIVALVWLGLHSRQPRPQGVRTTTSAGARATGPPSTQQFSDPREYAAAMTLYSLTSAQARVLGRPDCGSFVTWRAWVCTAVFAATPCLQIRSRCGWARRCSGAERERPCAPMWTQIKPRFRKAGNPCGAAVPRLGLAVTRRGPAPTLYSQAAGRRAPR